MIIRLKRFLKPLLYALLGIVLLSAAWPAGPQCSEMNTGTGTSVIIFSSSRGGCWQLWQIHADGTGLRKLDFFGDELHYPARSADGKKTAFVDSSRRIWTVSGSNRQLLQNQPQDCSHPAWSPCGDVLLFTAYFFKNGREDSDIWIADIRQGGCGKLANLDGIQSYPAWSPDCSTIAYTRGFRISPEKIVEELWLADADGRNPRLLLSDSYSNIQPAWSPDGKRIAFASSRSGNMDIWVMDIRSRQLMQLTSDPAYDADPAWSPDGSRLCFVSTRGGKMDLWLMDSSGSNQRQLTGRSDSESESKEPVWSH